MDSLPYRNDAAIVFRRLIRSLPRRRGVLGVAAVQPCDVDVVAGLREPGEQGAQARCKLLSGDPHDVQLALMRQQARRGAGDPGGEARQPRSQSGRGRAARIVD